MVLFFLLAVAPGNDVLIQFKITLRLQFKRIFEFNQLATLPTSFLPQRVVIEQQSQTVSEIIDVFGSRPISSLHVPHHFGDSGAIKSDHRHGAGHRFILFFVAASQITG